jgi:hypothetical protein
MHQHISQERDEDLEYKDQRILLDWRKLTKMKTMQKQEREKRGRRVSPHREEEEEERDDEETWQMEDTQQR